MKKPTYILIMHLIAFFSSSPAVADDVPQTEISGVLAPSVHYFDYFEGFGEEKIQFLEKYNYQKGLTGDRRSDFYMDISGLNLTISDRERDILTIEREGFGYYNHRGKLKINSEKMGLFSSYSFFRTASGGIDYLFSPNQVAGGTDSTYTAGTVGYVGKFNDDSNQFLYKISRTNYSAAVDLKSPLLRNIGSITVAHEGYFREGNRFTPFILGGGDVQGTDATAKAQIRWRGYNKEVDETANKVSINLTLSPKNLFVFNYELSLKKFDNDARNTTLSDISAISGISFGPAGATPTFTSGRENLPLNFVPDSTTTTHRFRVTRNFSDKVVVGAGYGFSIFEQDSFTEREQLAGYNTGEIITDSAYVNAVFKVSSFLGIEGFVKYLNRDNGSSFPAAGFYDLTTSERLVTPRIDRIESLNYGAEARIYPPVLKSNVSVGWSHERKDRDLTFGQSSAYIPPERTLYRSDTSLNEIYLKLTTRPSKGLTFRVKSSYAFADKTGLIIEPEKSTRLNLSLDYHTPELAGLNVSGFYSFKESRNNDHSFLSGTNQTPVNQDIEKTFNSAGIVTSVNLAENTSAILSYTWNQDDLESIFLSTDRRRYELTPAVIYAIRERQKYSVDTHTFSVGTIWQALSYLSLNGNYSLAASNGDAASGTVQSALPSVDARIDNFLHTLSVGANYEVRKNMDLMANYTFDYYKDNAFDELTGGVNAFMVRLAGRF